MYIVYLYIVYSVQYPCTLSVHGTRMILAWFKNLYYSIPLCIHISWISRIFPTCSEFLKENIQKIYSSETQPKYRLNCRNMQGAHSFSFRGAPPPPFFLILGAAPKYTNISTSVSRRNKNKLVGSTTIHRGRFFVMISSQCSTHNRRICLRNCWLIQG